MKRIIEFEGYADQYCGWEFDMPVYMVNPVLGYTEHGNWGGADYIVEDYLIDRAIGEEYQPYEPMCKEELISIKSTFSRAKAGKARDGILYWRNVIEVDDDDLDYSRDIEPMTGLDGHRNSKKKK
jgi:hypothetical protein